MRRDHVVLGGTGDFVVVRCQRRSAVRGNLAQETACVIATRGLLMIACAHIRHRMVRRLRREARVHMRLRDEGLRRGSQQQQQDRKALHSMALVISSTIFLASPNTIIVLSM